MRVLVHRIAKRKCLADSEGVDERCTEWAVMERQVFMCEDQIRQGSRLAEQARVVLPR